MSAPDVIAIRQEFPLLASRDLPAPGTRPSYVYFDNAATTLKPRAVLEALRHYYEECPANVHRGVHRLSEEATTLFEATRDKVKSFIGAKSREEIIYTSGTTQALNTVALGWARHHLKAGDEVLLTEMEHHANIVPWHLLAQEIGIVLKFIPLDRNNEGQLNLEAAKTLISGRTKIASFVMVSNALGTINPIREMMSLVRDLARPDTPIILDAAQAIAHDIVDVRSLGCAALAFSGHKIFGPTGTGILYLEESFRDEFKPVFGGGDMIKQVELSGSSFADFPAKLEAGTPNIAGFIGLGAALDFVEGVGRETIRQREIELGRLLHEKVSRISGLRMLGASQKANTPPIPICTFVMDGAHPHDVASLLDQSGVAIRSGHHCAQPLHKALGVAASARASLSFYNTESEIELFAGALEKAKDILG